MKTVVGLFDHFEDARRAVQDLRDAGYSNEDISMIASDEKGEYSRYLDADRMGAKEDVGDGAAAGAGIGAVLGGLGGLLVGLGALMIPGIGPVIAAGPIITTLAGAGVGAVAGGILGALVDLGIPEEHAGYYAEGVRRGGTLVVLRTEDMGADRAADIMNRYHPVDVERRAATWREGGWQHFNPEDETTFDRQHNTSNIPVTGSGFDSSMGGTHGTTDQDFNTGVGNQGYNRGTTGADYQSDLGTSGYNRDEVMGRDSNMEHDRDVNRDFDQGSTGIGGSMSDTTNPRDFNNSGRAQGEDFNRQRSDQDFDRSSYRSSDSDMDDDIPVTGGMRSSSYSEATFGQDVEPMQREWSYYDEQFRTDYTDRYAGSGQTYAYYQPAYRFGYDLASDAQYRDWDWDQMEPVARQEWQRRGLMGHWEDFKDAVRHAWDSVVH